MRGWAEQLDVLEVQQEQLTLGNGVRRDPQPFAGVAKQFMTFDCMSKAVGAACMIPLMAQLGSHV